MTAAFPGWPAAALPFISADEMRRVDTVMIEDIGIGLVQMMENAGRNLADLTVRRFRPATVTVLAGSGGNGGGGLVAARHLSNRGVDVGVVLAEPDRHMTAVPRLQLDILHSMGVAADADPRPADLVVDAIIGYSLRGDPRGRHADLIEWINGQGAPVVSLDNPSGLDVTSGAAATPCVSATATMTLALPKTGLAEAAQVGELYLADISVPPAVYQRLGKTVPNLFAAASIVRIEI